MKTKPQLTEAMENRLFKFVDDLFVNSDGEEAERLLLCRNDSLGGLSKAALKARLRDALLEIENGKAGE